MTPYRILLFFLLCCCSESFGQLKKLFKDTIPTSYLPRYEIKFSPLHLLNFYPTWQIAYEQHLFRNFSLQTDAGYVIDYKGRSNRYFQHMRGVKLKTELRYYIPGTIKPRVAQYLAAEYYNNIINFTRDRGQTECYDLGCTILYTRQYRYTMEYREQGIAFKYGIHRYGKRITLDMNIGTSIRFVEYKSPPLPPSFGGSESGYYHPSLKNERTRISPGIVGGFRVGFRIR